MSLRRCRSTDLRVAPNLLKLLGAVETAIGVWILTGIAPIVCAVAQTALLVTLNLCGVLWARRLIDDPAGMVVKNFAFLVLVWVSASFPVWTMSSTAPITAWQNGGFRAARAGRRKLLFGCMYEDAAIELRVFQPRGRVFCIASAGCTAMKLAAHHTVVAVDINPVQVAYVQERLGGAVS